MLEIPTWTAVVVAVVTPLLAFAARCSVRGGGDVPNERRTGGDGTIGGDGAGAHTSTRLAARAQGEVTGMADAPGGVGQLPRGKGSAWTLSRSVAVASVTTASSGGS